MGGAEHGGATLKTESTLLQSLEVAEVGTLSDGRRVGSYVALLAEMERIRTMRIVGADPCIEAWWSE
jgi:hypothetical protein